MAEGQLGKAMMVIRLHQPPSQLPSAGTLDYIWPTQVAGPSRRLTAITRQAGSRLSWPKQSVAVWL